MFARRSAVFARPNTSVRRKIGQRPIWSQYPLQTAPRSQCSLFCRSAVAAILSIKSEILLQNSGYSWILRQNKPFHPVWLRQMLVSSSFASQNPATFFFHKEKSGQKRNGWGALPPTPPTYFSFAKKSMQKKQCYFSFLKELLKKFTKQLFTFFKKSKAKNAIINGGPNFVPKFWPWGFVCSIFRSS